MMNMRGLFSVIVAILLAATPVAAQSVGQDRPRPTMQLPAPSTSPNWRPPPASAFPALEAALVPVNVELKSAMEDLFAGVGALSSQSYALVVAVLTGKGSGAVNDIAKLAAGVDADLTRMQAAAAAGLAVLDSYPSEACSADYVGVVRTAFLMIGDSVDALRANDLRSADAEIFNGRYLFATYAELVRSLVVCE